MDIVVDDRVIVEVKTVERLIAVHEAQLLSYLKMADKRVGLLLNFHTAILRNGIKRMVNKY
jgi:GxxExxY protein